MKDHVTIKPIRTDADHETALAEIDSLMGATPGTPEHDRLEILGILVSHYEERRWPIEDDTTEVKLRLRIANETLLELRSRMSLLEKRIRALEKD